MKKIILIVGARPNFMKAYPVYEALKEDFELTLIHTGQHFDAKMSDVFFNQLKFPKPDIHLSLEKKTKTGDFDDKLYQNNLEYLKNKDKVIEDLINYKGELGQMGEIRDKLKKEFEHLKPDLVIVFGDVTSTLAAGLASKMLNIDVAHVESGLRSGDIRMPEEVNRILTDHITKYYFVTEQSGVYNLKEIGIIENIYLVGNTMIDTQKKYLQQALETKYYEKLDVNSKEYILITLHRPSNVDNIDKLKEIFDDIEILSRTERMVYPIHPRTKKNLEKLGYLKKVEENPNIILDEPLGYLEFTCLMAHCKYIITDSGGLQEESTSLNIPCFTLRENTERPSTLIQNNGTNQLIRRVSEIELKECKGAMDLWDGKANKRIKSIIKVILNQLNIGINVGGYHEIGTGHIFRQINMMEEKPDFNYFFYITDNHVLAKKVLEEEMVDYTIYGDYEELKKKILENKIDIFINDILDTDEKLMNSLSNVFTLNYEDRGVGLKTADIVINDMYPVENYLSYKNVYTGIEYTCIRRDLILFKESQLNKNVKNIFISFGGSDPSNFTKMVLDVIIENKVNYECKIIVILGLGYKYDDYIYNNYSKQNIKIYKNVKNMARLMRNSDFAFTSNGRTILELSYFGVPSVSMAQNDREQTHIHAKKENGIIFLGQKNNFTNKDILDNMNLLFKYEVRKKLKECMKNCREKLLKSNKKIWDLILEKYKAKNV
jgi:UDP-N-acetylglucosamine 2-epimerase (non-hydrolysing)